MSQNRPIHFLLLFILLTFAAPRAFAQPALPDIIGVSQKGLNILSWTSQYDGIKSIAVQRSVDSIYNFASVGYVKNLAKGPQAFIDGHPNPGKNWYRLYIVFNSDLTWFSNRVLITVDSADLLKSRIVMSEDSLQKLASRVRVVDTTKPSVAANTSKSPTATTVTSVSLDGTTTTTVTPPKPIPAPRPVITLAIPDASTVDAYAYLKSEYVFTNPFTGHINVEIKDSRAHQYSLLFYDQKTNKLVLEIPRVSEPVVIIDKRNFQKKGMYRFELMKNKEKLEAGYITIY